MTTLYLDTEFNGHGGSLISMALASTDGEHFYGVWNLPHDIHPWVKQHVIPLLYSVEDPRLIHEGFAASRAALHAFLSRHQGATIVADWPADFGFLMSELVGSSFEQALNYQCTMKLIQTPPGEPKPLVPHNALSDAIALMEFCERRTA